MPNDYPELDEAMMYAMVEDYEGDNVVTIDNDPELPDVPLPPEEEYPELPAFSDDDMNLQAQPMEVQQANKEVTVKHDDVQDLALIENVFDKRITDRDIARKQEDELRRNDSGRLLEKDDVEVKTELNDKEILAISKLRFISDRYEVPALYDFTENLMTLKISRNRKGRIEFIQGLHADERREQPQQSWWGRLFGGGTQ